MYKNVGKTIMVLAQVGGWLLLIAGVIVALASGNEFLDGGWIWLVAGVVGFLSSWILYGFGRLIDDVSALRRGRQEPVQAAPADELPEL